MATTSIPTLAIIGAGNRGAAYAQYVKDHPDEGKIVAIAEPRSWHRRKIAQQHDIPDTHVFTDGSDLLEGPRMADALIVATTERLHAQAAIRAAERGYQVLLEKPMAPSAEESMDIATAAQKNGILLAVCHVLRYAPFYRMMKELLESGVIGEICSIQHLEGIAWWHYAHSYVRGIFRNEAISSSLLLAKSCHDIDILRWWVDRPCRWVSSTGHLKHFRPENQPEGATERCLDCPLADGDCPYSAKAFYFDRLRKGLHGWPLSTILTTFTEEALEQTLRTGPHGRCVYRCDNDVMDSQSVLLDFEGDVMADFTLSAFTPHGRKTRILGTQGYLEGNEKSIRHQNFKNGEWTEFEVNREAGDITGGHGGGDRGLMKAFLSALRHDNPETITTGPEISLDSHLIAFAAERARLEQRIVRLEEMYPSQS